MKSDSGSSDGLLAETNSSDHKKKKGRENEEGKSTALFSSSLVSLFSNALSLSLFWSPLLVPAHSPTRLLRHLDGSATKRTWHERAGSEPSNRVLEESETFVVCAERDLCNFGELATAAWSERLQCRAVILNYSLYSHRKNKKQKSFCTKPSGRTWFREFSWENGAITNCFERRSKIIRNSVPKFIYERDCSIKCSSVIFRL